MYDCQEIPCAMADKGQRLSNLSKKKRQPKTYGMRKRMLKKRRAIIVAPGEDDIDLSHWSSYSIVNEFIRVILVICYMRRRCQLKVPKMYVLYEFASMAYHSLNLLKYFILCAVSLVPILHPYYFIVCHIPGRLVAPIDAGTTYATLLITSQLAVCVLHVFYRLYNLVIARNDKLNRDVMLCFLPESYFEPIMKRTNRKYKIGSRSFEFDPCYGSSDCISNNKQQATQSIIKLINRDSPHFTQCDSIYSWHLYKTNGNIYDQLVKDDRNWINSARNRKRTYFQNATTMDESGRNLRSDQYIAYREQKKELLTKKRRNCISSFISRGFRCVFLFAGVAIALFFTIITPENFHAFEKRYPSECSKPSENYLQLRNLIDLFESIVFFGDGLLALTIPFLLFMTIIYDILAQAGSLKRRLIENIKIMNNNLHNNKKSNKADQYGSPVSSESSLLVQSDEIAYRHNFGQTVSVSNKVQENSKNAFLNNNYLIPIDYAIDNSIWPTNIYDIQNDLLDFFNYIEYINKFSNLVVAQIMFACLVIYIWLLILIILYKVLEDGIMAFLVTVTCVITTVLLGLLFAVTGLVRSVVLQLYPIIASFIARDDNLITKKRWRLVYEYYFPKFRCAFSCAGLFVMSWSAFFQVSNALISFNFIKNFTAIHLNCVQEQWVSSYPLNADSSSSMLFITTYLCDVNHSLYIYDDIMSYMYNNVI